MKNTPFALALTLAACAASTATFAQSPSSPGSVLSAQGGRYVFGQISSFRRDQYLLDTQTGRLWFVACQKEAEDKSCAFSAMEAMPFVGQDRKLSFSPEASSPAK